MRPLSGTALALCATLFLCPVTAAAQAVSTDLVDRLDQWLDRSAPWPRRETRPEIRLSPVPDVFDGQANFYGGRPRGTYDAQTATITLFLPWSADDPRDVSVLLHELVHHRQHGAQHWVCPGAQEKPAYDLQSRWLAENDTSININWIAVVLESGCSRRDVHPD